MCVSNNVTSEHSFLLKNVGKKTIKAYKVLNKNGVSPHYDTTYGVGSHTAGLYDNYKYDGNLGATSGIHVYLDRATAECHEGLTRCLVEVNCEMKDFLRADVSQAAFKKITITKTQWNNFQKRIKTLQL